MNSNSIKTQFYTWLSGKVSSKILSGLYLRMDDIDSHCIKNGITTIPLLETTNLSTILKVRTLVSQNKFFKLKHRKHAKDYVVIVDYYYEFIKDHYRPETSQTNDSQEAETINVQSADKTEDAHVIVIQERPEETKLIDYSNIDDLIGTTPVCFDYFGKKHLLEETTWKQLYIQVFTVLYEDYPDKISKMIGKRIANCGRVDLARGANKDKLVSPHYVGEDIYIETLQGTKDYIAKLKALLDDCLVDYENLQIYYLHKYQKTEKRETESALASMNESAKNQLQNISVKSFDLSNIPKLKYTKPVSCELKDRFVLDDLKSWNQLYVDAVKELLKSFPHYIKPLTNKRFPGSSRIEIANGDTMIDLRKAVAIGTNLFIETNHSATTIAARLKYLVLKCKLPLNSFSVNYISEKERPNNAAINMDVMRDNDPQSDFSDWLINNQKLSASTARNYSSGISVCESFMKEHAIGTGRLYSASTEEVASNTEKLLTDKQFQDLNAIQHNRLSASLNKYSSFRGTTALQNKSYTNEALTLSKVSKKRQTNKYNSETINNVTTVLETHYQYGFKRNSIREILRFRQFADSLCLSIPDNDEQLVEVIELIGETIDDKIYYKSGNLNDELLTLVDSVFEQGVKVIYYESFYAINADWMEKSFIASEYVLKEYLEKIVPGCSFSKKFMTKGTKETEKVAITEEIKRVWGNKQILEVEELSKKLPYIPLNNIWRVISGNDNFVLAYEGAYLNTDFLIISQEQIDDIIKYVKNACYEKGFVSLLEIPIEGIEEENYDVPKSAIFRAIYNIVLSDKYHINGKILTKDKPDLDAVSLLKQHVKGKDFCTFEEAQETLIGLTGVSNRQYVFQALYDEMIRVDKNRFVSDSNVRFNVDEIDEELSSFMGNHFCSIQDITTFAMFPVCGQTWNHYLLESFCYKYSKKHSLHIKNFNDKNAGIIAEKSYLENYEEMLAIVIAKSDVELTVEAVGQYLYENGYMAKRKYAKYPVVIQRASDLRKSR